MNNIQLIQEDYAIGDAIRISCSLGLKEGYIVDFFEDRIKLRPYEAGRKPFSIQNSTITDWEEGYMPCNNLSIKEDSSLSAYSQSGTLYVNGKELKATTDDLHLPHSGILPHDLIADGESASSASRDTFDGNSNIAVTSLSIDTAEDIDEIHPNELDNETSVPVEDVSTGEIETISLIPDSTIHSSNDSIIFRTENHQDMGVKVIGKIDISKIDNRPRFSLGQIKKQSSVSSISNDLQKNENGDIEQLLSGNGVLKKLFPQYGYGYIKSFNNPLKDLYVPIKEIIHWQNRIDYPSIGDEVMFGLGRNSRGDIAVCVHRRCTRNDLEDWIDHIHTFDRQNSERLRQQLLSSDDDSVVEEKHINESISSYNALLDHFNLQYSGTGQVQPDDIEKLFADRLEPLEYIKAIKLLIDLTLKLDKTKIYNIFLRSISYLRKNGLNNIAIELADHALKIFKNAGGKESYFQRLKKDIKDTQSRISITPQTLKETLSISEKKFGPLDPIVYNALLNHPGFAEVTLDKISITKGLYKEGYISELRNSLSRADRKDAKRSDAMAYLTLMKLEMSFHPEEYNPHQDASSYLINRAKQLLLIDNPYYEEVRYLLSLSMNKRNFERGDDGTPTLYLMSMVGYSTANFEDYINGNQAPYKLDDILTKAIEKKQDQNSINLAYLAASNAWIRNKILKRYQEVEMTPSVVNNLPQIINHIQKQYNEFQIDPLAQFKNFLETLDESGILIGKEIMIVKEVSRKLANIISEFNTADKYETLRTSFYSGTKLASQIKQTLLDSPTKIGYEFIIPAIELLIERLHDRFSEVEYRLSPDVEIDIINTPLSVIESSTINANIAIKKPENKKSSRDIRLISISADGDDLSEIAKVDIDKKIGNDNEPITLNIKLGIKKSCIDEGIAETRFILKYEDLFSCDDHHIKEERIFYKKLPLTRESFSEIENPYLSPSGGTELGKDDNMFFGRSAILNEIKQEILASYNSQIAIYGQKRSGKSSVLNRLANLFSTDLNVIVCPKISIQSYTDKNVSFDFERWLFEELIKSISRIRNVREIITKDKMVSIFNQSSNPFDGFAMVMQFIRDNKRFSSSHFVFIIDEFTDLYQLIKDKKVDESFMQRWKALVETPDVKIQTVVAAQDTLPAFMNEDYAANAFGIFSLKLLSYLPREEMFDLIKKPVPRLKYHGKCADTLFDYTAGSAFFTQILCAKLVKHLNVKETTTVTHEEIEEVIERMCSGVEYIETNTFECLTNGGKGSEDKTIENKEVLRAIATLTCAGGECSLEELCNQLKKQLASSSVEQILNNLVTRRVVIKNGNKYSICVNLFKKWILKN